MKKRLLRWLQPLFVALAILFIVFLVRSQWDEVRSHQWQLQPVWLVASGACLAGAWALEIAVWLRLLHLIGGRIAYWPAARIWFLSAIVRYIPGNIWQPLSLTLLCQRRGVAPEATLTSVVLYQVLILLAVAPIAAVYFGLTGYWGLLTNLLSDLAPWLIGLGLAPVAIFVAQPSWLIDGVNWALRKLNRPVLNAGLSRSQLVILLALAVADWLLWGISFAALAFALQHYTPSQIVSLAPHLVAAYPVAYAIGFISFLTPSGLGVREGAFYLLLAPIMGGGAVTLAALAMRVWTTLGELLAAAISALFTERPAAPVVLSVNVPVESSPAPRDRQEQLT